MENSADSDGRECRMKVLRELYRERNPPFQYSLSLDDLLERLHIPGSQLQSQVQYLEHKGYLILRRTQIRTRVYHTLELTTKGIDLLEGCLSDPVVYMPLIVRATLVYTHLPTGVLHLYDAATMPLLKYEIENNDPRHAMLVLTSQIEGYSRSCSDTVEIPPFAHVSFVQLPQLLTEESKGLTDIRSATVHAWVKRLNGTDNPMIYQQDFEIYLLARNVIRWAVPDMSLTGGYRPLLEHVAAWVTPRVEPVKHMLREAIEFSPGRALLGYQGARDVQVARTQARAIYEALRTVCRLAYVNSPFAIGVGESQVFQAIRLPRESLAERCANCIDGSILYASLLEQAALEPMIVMMTGHAFLGWKAWSGDNTYEFLETTLTLREPFEHALEQGMDNYQRLIHNNWFDREVFDPNGFARLLDIKALHDSGIYPME